MTLDEAIIHCEETVKEQEEDANKWEYTLKVYRRRDYCDPSTIPTCEKELKRCKKCAEEHRQLAEWLKELKEFRLLLGTVESARWLYESWERYGEKK